MSIETRIDLMSKNLKEKAISEGWWDQETDPQFNWIKVIGEAKQLPVSKLATPKERYAAGKSLLENFSKEGNFRHVILE